MIQKIFKIVCLVILGLVIFYLGMAAGVSGYYNLMQWVGKQDAKKFQAELERPLREDVYGGKTPEETFDMYIDALKKGDLELASKYFTLGKRDTHLDFLKNASKERLEKYLNDIDGANHVWQLDDQRSSNMFEVYLISTREMTIRFSYNDISKVWKIDSL